MKPMLLVHGKKDQVAPIDGIRTLSDQYPIFKLAVVDDAGHHTLLTHPEQSLEYLMPFLRPDERT